MATYRTEAKRLLEDELGEPISIDKLVKYLRETSEKDYQYIGGTHVAVNPEALRLAAEYLSEYKSMIECIGER